MTTAYVVPQALVYQEFLSRSSAVTQPLRACIVGPSYQLVSSNVAGALGTYDPTTDTCKAWPGRETGAVVDQAWTRVFIDNALLQYFYNSATGGDSIQATYCAGLDLFSDSRLKNAIRASATNFKTYGSYARAAALKERDVKLGDTVKVSAVVDASLVTLWSYVAGFINEKIAGIVAAATSDKNNASAPMDTSSSISPRIAVTKIGFESSSVVVGGIVTPPNVPEQGYIDGVQFDEYLLEVTTGGAPADAVLRVISASGKDDVAALTPSDWDVSTPFGAKGLGITFTRSDSDVFEVGMQWTLAVNFGAVDVDPVSGGVYEGPTDTTYVVTVTKGGMFGGILGNPEVTVTTTTGIDASGPVEVSALNTDIDVGSYGTTIQFQTPMGAGQGLYAGDKYYIGVTAAAAGAVKTILLGHNLPSSLLGLDESGNCSVTPPDLSVTLYIKKNIEVDQDRTGYAPLTNWSTSATEVCLASGILAYDSTWVDGSGTMLALPVKGGTAWTMYRALRTANASVVGSLTDASAVEAALGQVTIDNPLALGVYMALLNSSGEPVYYIGVSADTLAGYSAACNKLLQRNDIYSVVPLTFDRDIQDMVAASSDAMSTPETGRWRRTILATELVSEIGVVTKDANGAVVLATITDDGLTSGLQYTIVECASDVALLTAGVRAGDVVRANFTTDGFGNETYSEYIVDVVLSETSLRLVSGPATANTMASRIEIWRNLTESEQVSATIAVAARLTNRRITSVWPDYFERNNVLTAGYYAAAAFAGLRSATVPQRSLTNIQLVGIDSVTRTTQRFTDEQLNTMAASGIMIITQNLSGDVYIRHNLTTDMSDVVHREESITANLDSISYLVLETVAPFIGSSNLTADTIAQIEVEVNDILEYLKNNSTIASVGGQLIDGKVSSITRHPTLADRLVLVLSLTLPAPVNNIEVHLTV